jgi:hypothetical protein
MKAGRRTRGNDLFAALVAFLVVFGVIYAVGRASIPTFRSTMADLVDGRSATSSPEPADSYAALLDALRVEQAFLGVPALLEVDGEVEGRFALGSAEAPPVWIPLQGDPPEPGQGFPVDVHVRFLAAAATLTVVADQAETGVVRSDRLTVILTTEGRTFASRAGQCSLELTSAGHAGETNPWVGLIIVPFYAGQVRCTDVGDLRSDDTISFVAVFSYDSHH